MSMYRCIICDKKIYDDEDHRCDPKVLARMDAAKKAVETKLDLYGTNNFVEPSFHRQLADGFDMLDGIGYGEYD